jgi:LysR family transcriptional regulator, hca operon transcriptional activator
MFKVVATEPFVVVLPREHRLASLEVINPQDIVGETFIAVSNTAPVGRKVVDDYLRRSGIDIKPDHEAETNTSPILKLFLSRIDDLIARVSKKTH